MRGFPKYINSMGDIENLKQEYPQELAAWLQDIYDYKDVWLMTSKLEEGNDGITDDTHKVVESTDPETKEVTERYQYELMEDPNGTIFRLGFASSDAVLELIRELEAAQ